MVSGPAGRWVGYLGSTSVYGEWEGQWVDEGCPARAEGGKGQARVIAEAEWEKVARDGGAAVHIFRLAGIYGPGRNALESLRAKGGSLAASGVDGSDASFISRVHVDDIVNVVRRSMADPDGPGCWVYNVADDCPASRADVFGHAAALMGVGGGPQGEPPTVPLAQQQGSKRRSAGNKRVSNGRVKERFGLELLYPSYREGLKALLHGRQQS
jgi:nucleoside-diphosphate-sugar epimerase